LRTQPASFGWNAPLGKTLLPRHSFLSSRGLPHGAELLRANRSGLHRLLLQPKSDAAFAEAVCTAARSDGSEGLARADVLADFAVWATAVRNGGIEALVPSFLFRHPFVGPFCIRVESGRHRCANHDFFPTLRGDDACAPCCFPRWHI